MADIFASRTIDVTTGDRESVHDLTDACAAFLGEVARGRSGLLNIFTPHATAGLAVIETGAGSDDDLLKALGSLLPADDRWRHRHGSPATAGTTYCPRSSRPTRRCP